jgi:MFS family permease
MFNVPYFFSLVGLQNIAFSSHLIVTGVLTAGILLSFLLVDKVGRRPLLLCGGAVMSSCVFVVGGIGFTNITESIGRLLVAMCCIWVFAYALSVAPIGWLSLVENSSPMLRAQTAGIAAVMQSCSGVVFVSTVHCITARRKLTATELYGASDVVPAIRWLGGKNRVLLWSSSRTLHLACMVHCSRNNGTDIRRARRIIRATNTRLEILERNHIFARSHQLGAR